MIYFMQPTDGGPVKIGYTADVPTRHRQLERRYGRSLAILATMDGGPAEEVELHERFAHLRYGRSEQFRPATELMGFIGRPLLVDPNPDAVEAMDSPGLTPLIANFRGSEDFKAWLQELATFDRQSVAGLIERSLVHYARSIGFDKQPPER